jgi:hypothetical protein
VALTATHAHVLAAAMDGLSGRGHHIRGVCVCPPQECVCVSHTERG